MRMANEDGGDDTNDDCDDQERTTGKANRKINTKEEEAKDDDDQGMLNIYTDQWWPQWWRGGRQRSVEMSRRTRDKDWREEDKKGEEEIAETWKIEEEKVEWKEEWR